MTDRLGSAHPAKSTSGTEWTKSSFSHANGNCVEIADIEGGQVGMRDSKNVNGGVLRFPPEEWRAFLSGVRKGEFDRFQA